MNWNYITTRLATGSIPQNMEDGKILYDAGIRGVVSVCEDNSAQYLTPYGIECLHNPTPDDGSVKSNEWFKTTLDFVLPKLIVPKKSIYLHCHAGVQRGPSSTYAVMRAVGWFSADALAALRFHRPALGGAGVGYSKDADRAIRELGYSYL